jgi:hypothetical protein
MIKIALILRKMLLTSSPAIYGGNKMDILKSTNKESNNRKILSSTIHV